MPTHIIDRRKEKSHKNSSNKQRFLRRYKAQLRNHIKHRLQDNFDIQDFQKKDLKDKIKIPVRTTNEPRIVYDKNKGDLVLPVIGNDEYNKGDEVLIQKEKSGGTGQRPGKGDGEAVDDFAFYLTKKEFLGILFDDLELPRLIKENLNKITTLKYKRAGYVKEGPYCKLDMKKSFEQAIARRIATQEEGQTPHYLDEFDLRYRLHLPRPEYNRAAVVFLVMDVSGSMTESHKLLAKMFSLLVYLFLQEKYDKIEIRFIRYHHEAREVDEQEFFEGRDTGGTSVINAMNLTRECITSGSYSHSNVYVLLLSDGDYEYYSEAEMTAAVTAVIDLCQYFIYVQVNPLGILKLTGALIKFFQEHIKKDNVASVFISETQFIVPEFRKLFSKERVWTG